MAFPIALVGEFPELAHRNPNVMIEPRVADVPGNPLTVQDRTANIHAVHDEMSNLRRQLIDMNRAEGNLLPGGNVGNLTAGIDPRGRSSTRAAYSANLRRDRLTRQHEAIDDRLHSLSDTQERLRDLVNTGGNLDDHIPGIGDRIEAAQNVEDASERMVDGAEAAEQRARAVENYRYHTMEARMAFEAAHPEPHADADRQLVLRLRMNSLIGCAINASLGDPNEQRLGGRGNREAALGREEHSRQLAYAIAARDELEGLSFLTSDTFEPLITRHIIARQRSANLGFEVDIRLSKTRIGDELEQNDVNVVNHTQDLRMETIEGMQIHSTGRANELADAIIADYRNEERLAHRPDQSLNTYDRVYTRDGGILTHHGVVRYDDGSQARYNGTNWVRRNSDGNVWTGRPTANFNVPGFYTDGSLDTLPLNDFYDRVLERRDRAEEVRGPNATREAYFMDRAFTERCTAEIANINTLTDQLRGQVTDLDTYRTEWQNEMAQIQGRYAPGTPPANYAQADWSRWSKLHDAITLNQANTNLLHQQIHDAEAPIGDIRIAENVTRYWMARYEVNYRNPRDTSNNRTMSRRGHVFLDNVTINGVHGNWEIAIGGSGYHTDPNTGVATYYHPDGTV